MSKKQSPIKPLVSALKADPMYYLTWESNLACVFSDTYLRMHQDFSLREISNAAAKEFLRILMERKTE